MPPSTLKRPQQPMPTFIYEALEERQLLDDYYDRPPYQQNDYLSWITRAKQLITRQNRLNQMLDELQSGGVYMKMDHPPSRRSP